MIASSEKLNYQVSIFSRHDSLHDFIDRNIFQQIIHMRLILSIWWNDFSQT